MVGNSNNGAANNGDAFSPGTPPEISPIAGLPRQWQYMPGANYPRNPEPDKGLTFEQLREFSHRYDLLRRCLEIRKDEIRSLEWTITVRDRKNKQRMHELQVKNKDAIKQIEEFFRFPDSAKMVKVNGEWKRVGYVSYASWLSALLEDMFVIDAMTIYPQKKRNGELLALQRIDGATIRPMLGIDGRIPIDGSPAYQQYIFGVPRESFSVDELIYRPYYPSNISPYGNSLVNQIIKHLKLAINSEEFLSEFFESGAIPATLFTLPKEWSEEQYMEFADIMNARLSGNPKALREFNPVPEGTQAIALKPFNFESDFMNYIACMTCVLTGVQPTTAGIQPANSGLGGKSFSQQASEIHDEQMSYMAKWLQDLFTEIIQKYFMNDDLCFCFSHLLEREEEARANINATLIASGQKSLDEIYIEEGREPLGVLPFYVANDRLFGVADLVTLGTKGSTAVNLGMTGGVKLPNGKVTKDIEMPDAGNGVTTPNPNQSNDASAQIDTSHAQQPEDNKPAPPQPKKSRTGPNGPTVNTVKGKKSTKMVDADFVKRKQDDDQSRATRHHELIFIAAYLKLCTKVHYTSTMLNPQLVQAAFAMSGLKQSQLADALYDLKKEVYIDSWNQRAREDGQPTISDVPINVAGDLRQSANESASQISNTHNVDLQHEIDVLVGAGYTMQQLVDKLNDWQKQRNIWKSNQIAVTEVSRPWNSAVFAFDSANGLQDQQQYWVEPGSAQCANCQQMVDNSPYDFQTAQSLPIPNHPGCVHLITSEPM